MVSIGKTNTQIVLSLISFIKFNPHKNIIMIGNIFILLLSVITIITPIIIII